MQGRARVMKLAEKIVFPSPKPLPAPAAQPWPADQLLDMLTRNVGATVSVIGRDLRFIYATASFASWFGLEPQQLVGVPIREIYGEHNHARYMPFVERAMAGETLNYQRQVRNPAGLEEWHTVCLSPCRDAQGEIIGIVSSALDVHALRVTTEALRTANQRLSFHIDNSPLAVIEMDSSFSLIHCSSRASELFGWQEHEVRGRSVLDLLCSGDDTQVRLRLALDRLCRREEARNRSETTHRRADGSVVHCDWFNSALTDAQGAVMSIMALVEDVSARVQAASQLRELAERDSLTGLYNRSVFQVRLDAALARAQRAGTSVALLFIDLDGFKSINDSLGHRAGDSVLRGVAQRLLGVVRESDTLARLGGDEFVILLDTDVHDDAVDLLSRRILAALTPPFAAGDGQVMVGASIGVAMHPPLDCHPDRLLSLADEAMYAAKRAGKGCVRHAVAH
jgi:diguanylate cyclase (GGDEF)-like protein/PAS domain S-box-containing protein